MSIDAVFRRLQECGSLRAAYGETEAILVANETAPLLTQGALARFVASRKTRWTLAILSRLADEDFKVEHPELLSALVGLLRSDSQAVARMAALVLQNGGGAGEEALRTAMLPESVRDFIEWVR